MPEPVSAPVAVALADQISCVEREIGMRVRVYPRWVSQQKLTQEKADQELERMRAVLLTLRDLAAGVRPEVSAVVPPKDEVSIRRSERLKVLEIVGRSMHSGHYLRLEAAVRRELGA